MKAISNVMTNQKLNETIDRVERLERAEAYYQGIATK